MIGLLALALVVGPAAADPVEVATPADLDEVGEDLGADYVLVDDLDVSDRELDPIGAFDWEEETGFHGSFDGRGHEIRGLRLDRPDADHVGLFGHVAENGSIRDLGLVDVEVEGGRFVGGLAGSSAGSVENVSVSGSVEGERRAGGVVGDAGGRVDSTTVDVSVEANSTAGGVVGYLRPDGALLNSRSAGSVVADYSAGGVVGESSGDVEGGVSEARVEADRRSGGFVGLNRGNVSDATAIAGVRGGSHAGGLVGSSHGAVVSSIARGDVDALERVGGLVGSNDGEVRESSAEGRVRAADGPAGGVAGVNRGEVARSFSTGAVEADWAAGGVVGVNPGVVEDSYSHGDVEAARAAGGLSGLSPGEISTSYSVGSVDARFAAGALVGVMGTAEPPRPDFVRLRGSGGSSTAQKLGLDQAPSGGLESDSGSAAETAVLRHSYWDVEAAPLDPAGEVFGGSDIYITGVHGLASEDAVDENAVAGMPGLDFDEVWTPVRSSPPALQWQDVDAAIHVDDEASAPPEAPRADEADERLRAVGVVVLGSLLVAIALLFGLVAFRRRSGARD